MRRGDGWGSSDSRRDNWLSALVGGAIVVGVALGVWLPWETWRSGDEVVLGDFALLCLSFVAIARGGRQSRSTLFRRSGRWWALGMALGVLALREWAWRYRPEVLAVLHGVAVCLAVVMLSVPPLADLADLRRGRARSWTVDSSVSLAVGGLLVLWTLWALLF